MPVTVVSVPFRHIGRFMGPRITTLPYHLSVSSALLSVRPIRMPLLRPIPLGSYSTRQLSPRPVSDAARSWMVGVARTCDRGRRGTYRWLRGIPSPVSHQRRRLRDRDHPATLPCAVPARYDNPVDAAAAARKVISGQALVGAIRRFAVARCGAAWARSAAASPT